MWYHSGCFLLLPTFLYGQSEARTPSLGTLATYLEANGKAAYVSPDLTVKYKMAVKSSQGCTLMIQKEMDSGDLGLTWDVTLPLSDLSPKVNVNPDEDSGLFEAQVVSSSGEEAVPAHISRGGTPDSPEDFRWDSFAFVVPDRPTADTVAMYLSQAISSCGGTLRSLEGEELAKGRHAERDRSTEKLLGHTIPTDVRQQVVEVCQGQVKEKLKSPGTAVFGKDVMVSPTVTDSGLLILGEVEAQNGFGGFGQLHYTCMMDRYGKQYVPNSVMVR